MNKSTQEGSFVTRYINKQTLFAILAFLPVLIHFIWKYIIKCGFVLITKIYNKETLSSALNGEDKFYRAILVWCVFPLVIFATLEFFIGFVSYRTLFQGWSSLVPFILYAVIYVPVSIAILINNRMNTSLRTHSRAIIGIYSLVLLAVLSFFILKLLMLYKLVRVLFSENDISAYSFLISGAAVFVLLILSLIILIKKYPSKRITIAPETLADKQIQKRKKTLSNLSKVKEAGVVRYILKQSFYIALGISIANAATKSLIVGLIVFIPSFILAFFMNFFGWSAIDEKIERLKKEILHGRPEPHKSISTPQFLFFIILVCVFVSPLIYKEEYTELLMLRS